MYKINRTSGVKQGDSEEDSEEEEKEKEIYKKSQLPFLFRFSSWNATDRGLSDP